VRCLIIGKVWPEPDSTAAGRRTLDIIQALQAGGAEVTFATAARHTSYSQDLGTLNVAVRSIQPNDSAFDVWLAALNPDLVLFDRFIMEEQYGWRVENVCPTALRILDTSDLHCLREARRVQLEKGEALNVYNETALREIAAIYRSDLTLMIADYEVELLVETFGIPERQLAYLPFWLESNQTEFTLFDSRQDFMMIGSFLHSPNLDAVRWCKQSIWPLIRKELPYAALHCYGAYGDGYRTELHDPDNGFVYRGHAEDALETLQTYRVNCVPLRYGAGLKGKVFDGFRTGTPTVTTPIGAEGIVGNEAWGCSISEEPEIFAKTAVDLYTNSRFWKRVQMCGQQIARRRFDSGMWSQIVPRLIETARVHMAENRVRNFTGRMLRHHRHRSTEYMSRWIEAKNKNVGLFAVLSVTLQMLNL